ncbi:hypothetical protein K505DRAFT_380419 [Melanomma pulvis-pyrius CBS 109.77]|uniref:dihydroneopterin aldolase n=1 Tax=Melanomma pulvis-pyrius CBS 109.77 TaxID=1314802 RepID=A0A6A6WQL1_9PLEO|nr:hypothetical protein K505DRAFT_380419 [Melanomma pulvis-pyrius CBS 109.77]
MAQVVRQAVWQAQFAKEDVTDKITVRNLEVTANSGVDAWGREKEQRALVTVTLTFGQSFASAAAADSLDGSTVHYGILSKEIRSSIDSNRSAGHLGTGALSNHIHARALHTADKAPLASVEVDIFYPKGSLLGDGAGFRQCISYPNESASLVLYLQNVRVPCIIGINSNEREQKQPVVVNLWVEKVGAGRADDYTKLESLVVEAISNSSFETLESLSAMVVQELRQKFFTEADEGSYIRLRVAKPMAVPFADAPAIEIFRPVKA